MKIFLSFLFNLLIIKLSPNQSCKLANFRQTIMNRETRFNYVKESKMFKAIENKNAMYFYEKMRGINTYSHGIKERADSLARLYKLNLVNFEKNDTVIDCGANFGDIFNSLDKNLNINYISFEPSPKEFDCIKLNCKRQTNNNLALHNKSGKYEFFLKSNFGDSSLIEPAEGYNEKISVNTITLDDYVTKNNIEKIKLFKIEAEGSEPEVLEGAKNSLKKIKFITIDGGPERGLKKETTIEFAINYLLKNNFKLVALGIEHTEGAEIKGLFENTTI
jgi:FkbM family methyltransferase